MSESQTDHNDSEIRVVLSDQGLWALLNGRDKASGPLDQRTRQERIDSMLARLENLTDGLKSKQQVELVLRITPPSEGSS